MKLIRIACFVTALSWTLLNSPAAVPPPDKLLPADTLFMFTVPDYLKASNNLAQCPTTRLWNEPGIMAFKDKFMKKLQSDVIAPLEKEFGIKFSDYTALARGQLTFAVIKGDWQGQRKTSPGLVLLVDAKDKSDPLKANLAELKKKWIDSGKQVRPEKIRDLDFTTFIFSSDELTKTLDKVFPDPNEGFETREAPKPKKKPTNIEWTVGQSGSLLIVGSTPKDIEKILACQTGGTVPSLSEQTDFSASYNKFFRESLAYGWVNLKTLLDTALKAEPAPANSARPSPAKIMSLIGLPGLQTGSFSFNNAEDGMSLLLHLQVPESSQVGLFKILSLEKKDSSPPSFVPADAIKFNRFRIDLKKSFAAIEEMIGQFDPQYGNLLKTMIDLAGKDKDPNFDLRAQLIANLGDDIISYQKAPRNLTLEDLNSPPTLYLISSPKPEQLASAVKAVVSFLPPALSARAKEREFLGRKVSSLTFTSRTRDGKRTDKSLHYCASGGYVAISMDVAMLEEYLRSNTGKSLRDAAGLAESAQKAGGMSTGIFAFENQRETTRAALDILKKESGTLANLFNASPLAERLGVNETSGKFKDWVDFSLLPPFDQIAKYFYITVMSVGQSAEGYSLKMYSPVPPGLKK